MPAFYNRPMTTAIKLAHQNTVEILGTYGGDSEHACSAWTSTSRELTPEKVARIPALLKMLAENNHHSPFEKSSIHFLVTSELASHVHFLKHRIGVSVNSESARYKELKDDKYYVPQDWNDVEAARYVEYMENSLKEYHECLGRLVASGMDRKRAKESARLYLPYGNQLTIDVMFNFRSFAHFLNLRYSKHAQLEIREIAGEMLRQVASIEGKPFEHTLRAFGFVDENGNITSPRE